MKQKISPFDTLKKSFFKELESLWPVAKGSVSEVYKKCASPNCKICKKGKGHPAYIYTFRHSGKLYCMHLRPAFAKELKKAIKNGRRLEEMLVEFGKAAVLENRRISDQA